MSWRRLSTAQMLTGRRRRRPLQKRIARLSNWRLRWGWRRGVLRQTAPKQSPRVAPRPRHVLRLPLRPVMPRQFRTVMPQRFLSVMPQRFLSVMPQRFLPVIEPHHRHAPAQQSRVMALVVRSWAPELQSLASCRAAAGAGSGATAAPVSRVPAAYPAPAAALRQAESRARATRQLQSLERPSPAAAVQSLPRAHPPL